MTNDEWDSLEVGDLIRGSSFSTPHTIIKKISKNTLTKTTKYSYRLSPDGAASLPPLWTIIKKKNSSNVVCI